MITNQSPLIGGGGTVTCTTTPSTACGGYTSISATEVCTDISTLMDSVSGIKSSVETIRLNSSFVINYSLNGWITLGIQTGVNNTAPWSFSAYIKTTSRPDGTLNTPPIGTVLSLFQNRITNVTIPVIDVNNDVVRCRWAIVNSVNNSYDECGGACHAVYNSTYLIPDSCSLIFDSTGIAAGTSFAIALQLEDFIDSSNTDAMSSIPVQFLVRVVTAPTNCHSTPTITANVSACVGVTVNIPFTFQITITAGCNATTIQDVRRSPPLSMFRSSLTQTTNNANTTVWTFNEVWTPDATQIGAQVYCAVAIDSLSVTSPQYCNTFNVVAPGDEAL
ncbi:unnamed protein product, partial [Didymodactylos carnosus]